MPSVKVGEENASTSASEAPASAAMVAYSAGCTCGWVATFNRGGMRKLRLTAKTRRSTSLERARGGKRQRLTFAVR
jgi:hypothetical protein